MNPLEKLKEKLKMKPVVREKEEVKITLAPETEIITEDSTIQRPKTIVRDMTKEGYNPTAFLNKIRKVESRPTQMPAPEPETIIIQPKSKVKKMKSKLILEEEKEPVLEILPGGPGMIEAEKTQAEEPVIPPVSVAPSAPLKPEPSVRKKKEKGVIELGPAELVEFGDTTIQKRLPANDQVTIRSSTYYMNNREIFINFINGLFSDYKADLLDETKGISCDFLNQTSSEFSLLSHQKIVRDYINLYTPYRGLLLYHGLGSGKTCTSIAIAEGMKNEKKIIVMTPASLRRNYLEEIKKCGDLIYRKNQYWEWVSTEGNTNKLNTLSSVLSLPREFISRKKGAWLVNVTKPSNYTELSSSDKKQLDEQLDEMIQNKYTFINYNGLRRQKFKELTNNFEKNIFDDAVVIIDEAHNLISRIVNKINKTSKFSKMKRGPNAPLPIPLAIQLYEFLLRANNCKIILLTGTPIVNYPNEIGILFNILRGYIKSWSFTLEVEGNSKINKEALDKMFLKEKVLDYLDYKPSSKILVVTKNPYGFENKITEKTGYKGVTNEKKETIDETGAKVVEERGAISDEEFVKRVIKILKKNDINVSSKSTEYSVNTALPDTLEEFINIFVNTDNGSVNNIDKFKRRIIGLTSYFRSAQEELLPKYNKVEDLHVERIPMSDYQFKIYEKARQSERKTEKPSAKTKKIDAQGMFIEASSTYRIFSRLFCNFVMPIPPGRPMPPNFIEKEKEKEEKLAKKEAAKTAKFIAAEETKEDVVEDVVEEVVEAEPAPAPEQPEIATDVDNFKVLDAVNDEDLGERLQEYKDEDAKQRDRDELEGDELLDLVGDSNYRREIASALHYLRLHANTLLVPSGLESYSPKFLAMLNNIINPDHMGLHLIYSQFRSMEGIGIFSLVLEANGFTRFKIKKNSLNQWEIDISEKNLGKPTYALYTGTEDAEEREIIRNIYNGSWNFIPNNISDKLKQMSVNNDNGEIIKVLMITAAGSEGINLKNTRYVHIMEPYWHPARVEQVIGRARRLCSHQSLPVQLQTVEVFLYLMTFTPKQLESDEAIELRLKDLSKRAPYRPLTSDEMLFEISTIKEELSSQLLKAIKESSIDCATHARSNNKENLICLSFGNPPVTSFSYNPNYFEDENDTVNTLNKAVINWEGREFTIDGKKMVLRVDTNQVYDYESFMQAKRVPGMRPILIGTLQKKDGKYIIIKV